MQRAKSHKRAGKSTTNRQKKTAHAVRAKSIHDSKAASLSFRLRKPEDDAYIVQLTEEQLGTIHEQAFQQPFPSAQFARYLQSGAPTFIVERGGKRIGYYSYLIGPEAKMHISAMVIEKSQQSDGVGTAVMRHLEQNALAQGVRTLEVFVQSNNHQSVNFTKKLGFIEAFRVTPNSICFQKVIGATDAGLNEGAQPPAGYPFPQPTNSFAPGVDPTW